MSPGNVRLPDEDTPADPEDAFSGSLLSIQELCDHLAERIRPRIPFDRMSIAFIDLEKDRYTEAYVTGIDIPERRSGDVAPLDGTIVDGVVTVGAAIRLADETPEEIESRYPALKPSLNAGVRSLMAVPMFAGDRVVAALVLESLSPDTYKETHLDLGRQTSARITGQVEAARAFQTLQQDAAQLAKLAEVGRVLASAPDPAEVYDRFGQVVRTILPFDRLELVTIETAEGAVSFSWATGTEVPGREVGVSLPIQETAFAAAVRDGAGLIETGESRAKLAARYSSEAAALSSGLRSLMIAPLTAGSRVVAALAFHSVAPAAYSETHLAIAEKVAEQAAGPVAGALRTAQIERESQASSAIAEIAAAMGSSADPGEAFERAARQIGPLLPHDYIAAVQLEHETGVTSVVQATGANLPDRGVGASIEIDDESIATLAAGNSVVVSGDTSVEETAATLPRWRDAIVSGGLRSLLAAPLVVDDKAAHALILLSTEKDAYSGGAMATAQRLASVLAGLIANSQATSQLREAVDERKIVGEVAELVAGAREIDEVCEAAAEKLATVLPFDRIDISTVGAHGQTLARVYISGVSVPGTEESIPEPIVGTLEEEAVRARAPLLLHPTGAREVEDRFAFLATPFEAGLRSFLAAPMFSGDMVSGVLSLSSRDANAYGEAHAGLVSRVAVLLSEAMAAARSRAEAKRAAAEAGLLDDLARSLASSSAVRDAGDQVARIVRRLIHFDRLDIATVDSETETLTRVYASGLAAPDKERLGHPEPLTGSVESESIKLGASFPLDVRSPEEEAERFPLAEPAFEAGLRSFISTPLIITNRVVGVMTLASTDINAYTDADVAMAERVGFQLAGTISAAAALDVEEEDSGLGELPGPVEVDPESQPEILAEIGKAISSSVDVVEAYEPFAELARKLVHFVSLAIWTLDLRGENLVASYVSGADQSFQGKSFPLPAPPEGSARRQAPGERASPDDVIERLRELLPLPTGGLPLLLVPLASNDETVGMLSMKSKGPGAYTRRDVEVAQKIADQISGAVANAQVVRELKQVEDAVREAVGRMDRAIEGSGSGLWDWNIGGDEFWCSPLFTQMTGYPGQTEDGEEVEWYSLVHPEDRESLREALEDHVERRAPYSTEYRLLTPSGEYRWFSDRAQAKWDESGQAVRMSGALADITDAKWGERTSADDALRGPLDLMLGFRRALIEQRAEEGEGDAGISGLASAGHRIHQLVLDLQTLASVIDRKLQPEPVDLTAVARSVVRKLRRTREKRKITFFVARYLTAKADPLLLRILLEGLLDNAWKFTGRRSRARVEVGVTEQDGEPVYYVRDDGAGFDMADADKLFDLFQRLHPATEFEGTGVGLAIVRQIVLRHEGRVWAEGEIDGGATFFFTL